MDIQRLEVFDAVPGVEVGRRPVGGEAALRAGAVGVGEVGGGGEVEGGVGGL